MSAVLKFRPRVGRPWPGGVYGGLIDGHHLIRGPFHDGPLDWNSAIAWAHQLRVGGLAGFSLPTVAELIALATAFPTSFLRAPYWTGDVPADAHNDAMVCNFELGQILHWGRIYPCHACAVRRIRHSELPA